MAKKRTLTPDEQRRLRDQLQAATLAALMDSRRWEPGDLAFQGGTCLRLAHGSPRFSEDLDFMVRGGLSLNGLGKGILEQLRGVRGFPADMAVSVSPAKDDRNPHAFMVSLGGEGVIGSAKVKVELWQTPQDVLAGLHLLVRSVASPQGHGAVVPVLSLPELMADKVFALGARDRVKPRDVFDLWWLRQNHPQVQLEPPALIARLRIYPDGHKSAGDRAAAWRASAQERLDVLRAPQTVGIVAEDLRRWVPSSLPMGDATATAMLQVATEGLERGMAILGEGVSADGGRRVEGRAQP